MGCYVWPRSWQPKHWKTNPKKWPKRLNPVFGLKKITLSVCLKWQAMYSICKSTDFSLFNGARNLSSAELRLRKSQWPSTVVACVFVSALFYFFLQSFQSNGSSVILVASYGVPWALVMTCYTCPATNGSHVTLGWISLLKCFPHCTATQAEISGFKSNI